MTAAQFAALMKTIGTEPDRAKRLQDSEALLLQALNEAGYSQGVQAFLRNKNTSTITNIYYTKDTPNTSNTEIIAVCNQKGGVGKSTTVHALGQQLFLQGFSVLLIDLDPQGNLSYSMQAKPGPTAYELITGKAGARDTIQNHWADDQPDLIPGSPLLSGADIELSEADRAYRLRESLRPITGDYDFIIIDTPPALSSLTVNALTAASSAIITAAADMFSLMGIGQLFGTIETIRAYSNPGLTISGILLTRHSGRSILSRDLSRMISDTAADLKTKVFNTVIRECIALREAQAQRQDIFSYSPKSNAAQDYEAFTKEILGGRTK